MSFCVILITYHSVECCVSSEIMIMLYCFFYEATGSLVTRFIGLFTFECFTENDWAKYNNKLRWFELIKVVINVIKTREIVISRRHMRNYLVSPKFRDVWLSYWSQIANFLVLFPLMVWISTNMSPCFRNVVTNDSDNSNYYAIKEDNIIHTVFSLIFISRALVCLWSLYESSKWETHQSCFWTSKPIQSMM